MMSKDPKDLKIEEMQQEIDRLTTRRCPYNNWAQVNLKDDVMASTRQLLRKSPVACSLLLFILEKMDRQNALICSMAVFCEALGYSRQTISKGIKILKDANYISVKKYGGTYIYLLNSEIAWKSWGTGYEYAEFHSNVLLSKADITHKTQKTYTKHHAIVDVYNTDDTDDNDTDNDDEDNDTD